MAYGFGKLAAGLMVVAYYIWQAVIFITKLVFMILLWIEIKVQNANVYDMYIGCGRKGIRGETPGINHTPTKGGFFESTWREHFQSTDQRTGSSPGESGGRNDAGEMQDAYNGGKGSAAAGSVDNCVPKAATSPIEWWRGWNAAFNKEGYKYLKACRGKIKAKTITYQAPDPNWNGPTGTGPSIEFSRAVKVVSYKKDMALGWGFGNNNYPKFQAYLFPTCFTINQANIFKQMLAGGGMIRELFGKKSLSAFYLRISEKSTKEATKNCFHGKFSNKWRYNGEREWNPAEGLPVGVETQSPENTVNLRKTSTVNDPAAVNKQVATAGAITNAQVGANKKMCKPTSFYHDVTGNLKWPFKFADVMNLPAPLPAKATESKSVLSTLGLGTASKIRESKNPTVADATGSNTQPKMAYWSSWDASLKVSEGGYDGFDPGRLPGDNPTTCAPHAPFFFTANWGPATWNYNTIKMANYKMNCLSAADGGCTTAIANQLMSNPLTNGDNTKSYERIEWDSKYMNFARNQNNNGIFPGLTGYDPDMTYTELNIYLGAGAGLDKTRDAAEAAKLIPPRGGGAITSAQNAAGNGGQRVTSLSFKFYTDDSDPENRIITPLTKEDVLKKGKYRYSMRAGVKSPQQRVLGVKNRIPSQPKAMWGFQNSLVGSMLGYGSGTPKTTYRDDAVEWNYNALSGGSDKLRLCVGGMLNQDPIAKTSAKMSLVEFRKKTFPKYVTREIGVAYMIGDQCMGLAVIDMRPTAVSYWNTELQFIGGVLGRNSGITSLMALQTKLVHQLQVRSLQTQGVKIVKTSAKTNSETLMIFKAIPNAPGYGAGHKASACMKFKQSLFGKDCKPWFEPLEVLFTMFVCDDMTFGITIRSGPVPCATPYITSTSPKVIENSGETILKGADMKFPFNVSLSFKFWLKSTWYICVMVPFILYCIEGIIKAFGSATVAFPYNLIEFECGYGVAFHDWGKSAVDNMDASWYLKFCFQEPVFGPLLGPPICDADLLFSYPKALASCFTALEVKVLEVNPQLSIKLSMLLLGVCSKCGKLDLEYWKENGGIKDWKCMKVGMIAPTTQGAAGSQPTANVRNADGDCQGVTISLGKSVGRTGRARMAYAKQARCALAQDSCHDALESKDTSALTACLKDALSSRIQCDATARLDPYPSMGNLFAKEMDVFMGPNMGPNSATSMAAIRAGYAQGLGSLRVEHLSVQLTGSESDVKLRMNATVAPATAVQLRDVCWNWDDHMMRDVRHAKADKYTTSKQKGRFLVAAVQWHLKNGSGLDQKTRENMQDWVVMVKDMGSMGFLQKDPSVESREANTLSAGTSKMCSKLPLTGLRAELQMDVTSLGSGETAGQFSGSLRKFTVPLVEQAYHRTTQAQRAVESMLGGKRRFADVFGKIMREAKNIMDKEAQHLMKATCTELRVLCPTCSDEAWECGL